MGFRFRLPSRQPEHLPEGKAAFYTLQKQRIKLSGKQVEALHAALSVPSGQSTVCSPAAAAASPGKASFNPVTLENMFCSFAAFRFGLRQPTPAPSGAEVGGKPYVCCRVMVLLGGVLLSCMVCFARSVNGKLLESKMLANE